MLLAQEPELRKKLGAAAQAHARAQLSIPKMLTTYESAYDDISGTQ
jgi:hypothetical protein